MKTLDTLNDTQKLELLGGYAAQRTMPIEHLLAAFGITGTRDAANQRIKRLYVTMGACGIEYFR